ncbi:MAG: hypothetical protein AAGA55_03325 [Planctomycetota bacterium]
MPKEAPLSPWLMIILIGVLLVLTGGFFVIMFAQLASKRQNGRASTPGAVKPSRGRSTQKRSGGSSYKARAKKSR